MDYYGLLFLYYLKGLSGKSVLKLFFNIEAGGTEQLLPENTSTPTTTPILADIQYPDGLRTDQYFTYRETPTTVSNKARIKTIKGNTLVWNQLINYSRATQTVNGVTFTNNGDGSCSFVGTTTAMALYQMTEANMPIIQGHKYLFKGANGGNSNCRLDIRTSTDAVINESVNIGTDIIFTATQTDNCKCIIRVANGITISNAIKFVPQLFDLTQMFGAGNEPTTVEEFTSLFPLAYYAYNAGTLLSFNGSGIKTVSKNQFNTQVVTTSYQGLTLTKTQGTIRAIYSGGSQYAGFNFYGSPVFTDTFLKGRYRFSFDVSGLDTQWTIGLRRGATFISGQPIVISNDGHYSFTIDSEANPNCYLSFSRTGNKTTAYDVTFSNIQLELGTTETSYTPFEEQTISLPISQYFPTGMKSAGNVYDELTESKAITRVGNITPITGDALDSSRKLIRCGEVPNTINSTELYNAISNIYQNYNLGDCRNADYGFTIYGKYLYIRNKDCSTFVDYQTWLSNSPITIYYELATPTETPITTEDANEALSLLMGKSVSSDNAKQMIDIITKGE